MPTIKKLFEYWGSVRFFKHLILTTIFIILFVSVMVSSVLIVKNRTLNAELKNQIIKYAYLKTSLESSGHTSKPNINSPTYKDSEKPTASEAQIVPTVSFDYQSLYPDMYVNRDTLSFQKDSPNSVYLTFDDGPSKYTSTLLDLLKKNDIKATFFIVYNDTEDAKNLYLRMVSEGHALGVHSTSHDYNKIYTSPEAFLADFYTTENLLYEVTGVKPRIFRFPGGSINSYNPSTHKEIIAEMIRRGYLFYDWNVNAGDTEKNPTADSIINNVMKNSLKTDRSIILMHDTKAYTIEALPKIIKLLKENGAVFKKLDDTVKPITFSYSD